MLVNLYAATGVATTGGTWTYAGGLSPYPAAPSTYNANIDFDDLETLVFGDYSYTYTITTCSCTSSNTVTVTVGEQIEVINNECEGAINLPISGSFITNQTTLTTCPGNLVTLASDTNNFADISADVWYKSNTLSTAAYLQVNVIPETPAIGAGLNGTVFVSIYTGSCSSLSLKEEGAMSLTSTGYSYFSNLTYNNVALIYRIYSKTGTEGDFSINIQFDDP
jgi:hypothetical protein